jgi:hypothetical protein
MHAAQVAVQGQEHSGFEKANRVTGLQQRLPLTHIRWIDAIQRGQLTKYVLPCAQLF